MSHHFRFVIIIRCRDLGQGSDSESQSEIEEIHTIAASSLQEAKSMLRNHRCVGGGNCKIHRYFTIQSHTVQTISEERPTD